MLIREALAAGARLQRACNEAGICLRTWRRWLRNGEVQADQRSVAAKPVPANKLTPQEREQIIEICNRPAYSHLPPSQSVPDPLDKGRYIASESTLHRTPKTARQ